MRKILSIAAALSVFLSQQVSAFGVSPAVIYTNLNWNFSTNVAGLSACNNLVLDGTGNLATTTRFVAYGGLNCPGLGGGLAATGTGYIGTNGLFNMTLTFAGGSQLVCGNLNSNTLSGTCSVFNASGFQTGTAFIGYIP